MSGIGPLADSERQRLKDLARGEVGRVSERIRMVLLASRGYSVATPWLLRGYSVATPWLLRGYSVATPWRRSQPSSNVRR